MRVQLHRPMERRSVAREEYAVCSTERDVIGKRVVLNRRQQRRVAALIGGDGASVNVGAYTQMVELGVVPFVSNIDSMRHAHAPLFARRSATQRRRRGVRVRAPRRRAHKRGERVVRDVSLAVRLGRRARRARAVCDHLAAREPVAARPSRLPQRRRGRRERLRQLASARFDGGGLSLELPREGGAIVPALLCRQPKPTFFSSCCDDLLLSG